MNPAVVLKRLMKSNDISDSMKAAIVRIDGIQQALMSGNSQPFQRKYEKARASTLQVVPSDPG